jgi:hypothetical protein
LAYQSDVQRSCDGKTAGMCDDVAMVVLWEGVGEAALAETHKAQEGGFWWSAMLTLAVKPQWLRYKLDETIEKHCSDFLAHTSEVCKGILSVQWVFDYQG